MAVLWVNLYVPEVAKRQNLREKRGKPAGGEPAKSL